MEHLVKDDLWSNHDNKIYLAQKDSQNAYVPIPDHLSPFWPPGYYPEQCN